MTDKTPAPRFLGSSYASGTKQGQTAEVSSDGGEPVTSSRRECLATATGAGFGSPPYIMDHGNSPDLTQWLAHVKAFGWPFEHMADPRPPLTLWQRIKREYGSNPDRAIHVAAETLYNAHHSTRGRGLPAFSDDPDKDMWLARGERALSRFALFDDPRNVKDGE